MNCDKCTHSGICMFETGARDYEKTIAEVEKPAFIKIQVGCEKFKFKFATKKKEVKEA